MKILNYVILLLPCLLFGATPVRATDEAGIDAAIDSLWVDALAFRLSCIESLRQCSSYYRLRKYGKSCIPRLESRIKTNSACEPFASFVMKDILQGAEIPLDRPVFRTPQVETISLLLDPSFETFGAKVCPWISDEADAGKSQIRLYGKDSLSLLKGTLRQTIGRVRQGNYSMALLFLVPEGVSSVPYAIQFEWLVDSHWRVGAVIRGNLTKMDGESPTWKWVTVDDESPAGATKVRINISNLSKKVSTYFLMDFAKLNYLE